MSKQTQAAVIWFTGLSGSGKSTLAEVLVKRLTARGHEVELLDGDVLRAMLPAAGFSFQERDRQTRFAGLMAARLQAHGIWVVASLVSPYRSSRAAVRAGCGRFVEVFVATPLAECERRDTKGLYARARAGQLKNLTGVDDPYEAPEHPEVTVDTSGLTIDQALEQILGALER